MRIINFLKSLLGISICNSQASVDASTLDLASTQLSPIEYSTTEGGTRSPIADQTHKDLQDMPLAEIEKTDLESTSKETTSELQMFIAEIDRENLHDKTIDEGGTGTLTTETKIDEVRSLLDNTAYMVLADNCCDLIKELDKLKTEENNDLVDMISSRIMEGLISSGADSIAEETSYDVIRHTAIGKAIVRKGTPIVSTIKPGIAIGDKIMIKAKVEV